MLLTAVHWEAARTWRPGMRLVVVGSAAPVAASRNLVWQPGSAELEQKVSHAMHIL
jgi:hypothetical protein